MSKTHYFPYECVHHEWDNSLEPALTIASGDTVVFDFQDPGDLQLLPGSTHEDMKTYDWTRTYPISGPIYIEGAEPNDVLEIEILDLHPKGWGWTGVIPGFGLLKDELPDAYVRVFEFPNGDYIEFREDIHIPVAPFLGIMGVAPAETGKISMLPPSRRGGNMDTRQLNKGSKLLLPVEVKGALFSAGDGHTVQGDGEVCSTALECPLYGALRFRVIKGKSIPAPQYFVPADSISNKIGSQGYFSTTGIGPDLLECTRDAVSALVDHISTTYDMSKYEAYLLCSLTLSLRISEVVSPTYVVSAQLPLSIFK